MPAERLKVNLEPLLRNKDKLAKITLAYKFIESNVGLLENNNFDGLYRAYRQKFPSPIFLTLVLYDAGINPLPYFKNKIPDYFLFSSFITQWMKFLYKKNLLYLIILK